MSIRGLKKWALLLTFWVALQMRCLKATPITGDTVTGDFTATGSADIQGGTLSLGTNSATSDIGALTLYTDGTTSDVDFEASRSANVWRWWQNQHATLQLQMTLDNNNALVLYDQSSTPVAKVTLNPLGTSTFANSVTMNGTDNEMPNQTLVGTNSVLTEGLADSRYASSSNITAGSGTSSIWGGEEITGPTLGINGGTASGAYSFAEGLGSTSSGTYSTAVGYYSTASGNGSMAIGSSSAIGDGSTAIGSSSAIGSGSMAIGSSSAIGNGSMAIGSSTSSGNYSTAMGLYSIASGNYSTAIGYLANSSGYFSIALGSSTASGDSAIALGGGNANGYVSTAMGCASNANGVYSTAMGYSTTASGLYSTASGQYSRASGSASMAMGSETTASGDNSTSMGRYTMAQAFGSVALGRFNVGGGNPTSWVATDPLFEIGNGSASGYHFNPSTNTIDYTPAVSDALVVYKNGNTAVQGSVTTGGGITSGGVITAQPGGDIPMFTGN